MPLAGFELAHVMLSGWLHVCCVADELDTEMVLLTAKAELTHPLLIHLKCLPCSGCG